MVLVHECSGEEAVFRMIRSNGETCAVVISWLSAIHRGCFWSKRLFHGDWDGRTSGVHVLPAIGVPEEGCSA